MIIEDIRTFGKDFVDTFTGKVIKNVLDNIKTFVIKIIIFAVLLLIALIFAIAGMIKVLSQFRIFDSGIGFLIAAFILLIISVTVFETIQNR